MLNFLTGSQCIWNGYLGGILQTMKFAFQATSSHLQGSECAKCPLSRTLDVLYFAAERVRLGRIKLDSHDSNTLASIKTFT